MTGNRHGGFQRAEPLEAFQVEVHITIGVIIDHNRPGICHHVATHQGARGALEKAQVARMVSGRVQAAYAPGAHPGQFEIRAIAQRPPPRELGQGFRVAVNGNAVMSRQARREGTVIGMSVGKQYGRGPATDPFANIIEMQ